MNLWLLVPIACATAVAFVVGWWVSGAIATWQDARWQRHAAYRRGMALCSRYSGWTKQRLAMRNNQVVEGMVVAKWPGYSTDLMDKDTRWVAND